jgi:hypothetical protein
MHASFIRLLAGMLEFGLAFPFMVGSHAIPTIVLNMLTKNMTFHGFSSHPIFGDVSYL